MMNKQTALEIVGGLSAPSKMPCYGFSISAKRCITGMKMRKVEGSICEGCYALKGRYSFNQTQNALERRYKALSHPQWVEAMVWLINHVEKSGYFRWHDSGDIQSVEHLDKIAEVCRRTPKIKHWIPTREYVGRDGKPSILAEYFASGYTLPVNVTMRLSALMLNAAPPTSIAKRFGVLTSGVSSGSFTCPASNQGNSCADCRACWDKNVQNIDYKKH